MVGGGDAMDGLLAEAVAAFDAANHAWGRFWHYTPHPRGDTLSAWSAVRAAFQDAALDVPADVDADSLHAFYDALVAARRESEGLIAELPAEVRSGDILSVPETLGEAIALLDELLNAT